MSASSFKPRAKSTTQPVNRFPEDTGDSQIRETRGEDGGNLDIPIPRELSRITTEPHSVGHEERTVQRREIQSMRIRRRRALNTGNQTVTSPTQNSDIHTGGGAHFDNAHFVGGGHAFGSNATVNYGTIIRFGDDQFTEDQRGLICDYIANLAVLPGINEKFNKHVLTQLIINLPRAEAVFNDYQTKKKSGPCFEGTRVALLREMADWVTGPGESRIYVLSGLAGIGKSTVAYTIASRAADLNLLGASFFFSRDEMDRKNAKKFFTTIAYQLCVYNDAFAKAIGDALLTERGSAAMTKDAQEQLQALVVEPLRSIVQSCARPILVVVDALDECDEDDALSVIDGLTQLVQDLPSFKVILTARPQPQLDYIFSNLEGHKMFHLQDIEDKVVDGDIRLYLQHSLSLEQVKKRYPTKKWCANNKEIDYLVHAAGRLFIIAATAVRFVLDKIASNPAGQMQKLLRFSAQDRMPFKDLNEFYTIILRNVVPVDCDDEEIVWRYQSVVGAIILIQSPLPVTALAHLIDIDVEEVRAVLDNLQSVILLGDNDIPLIYHKSFPDYITDSKRCQDVNLRIDPRMHHTQITIFCFEIMDQHLKYNILGLGDPARFMSNEDGLAKESVTHEQLEESIPQQLRYACIYWFVHFEVGNTDDADIGTELVKFTDQHVLHWFEALSLIQKLGSAHQAIRIVLKLLKPTSPSDLRQLLSDGLRFISKFYEIIERSALHTYYSALPFTPTDSLLYRRYSKEGLHNFCEVTGAQDRWDALVAHLVHEEIVQDIRFSLDSTAFISLAEKMTKESLKIWDAATGTPIKTIQGNHLAFANDISSIASVKSNTITVYNANGSELGATFTTRGTILRVAISPKNSRIAAGLSNGAVYLWDSGTSEPVGDYGDQFWDHLQFSATGARLAYLSTNGVVQLRDGIDGHVIANLDCRSQFYEKAFLAVVAEFSHDGSRIALLQSGYDLGVWSCEGGEFVGIAKNAGFRLTISSNGSLLATKQDRKVKLWDGNSGNPLPLIEVLDFDFDSTSMAFSGLDDTLAIATKSKIKLYNVKSHSFISTLPFIVSHNTPLAFSSDGTRLAAGNRDGSVHLWDIQGIKMSNSSPNEQVSNEITTLALSLDCSRVACGFEDGAIELWETSSLAKRRMAAHRHHPAKITTFRFSPDGRRFASGSDNGTINLWDSEGGVLIGALEYQMLGSDARLLAMEVSNNVLAASGNKGIALWDLRTLDHIHTFEGSFQAPLSFSANGKHLAAIVRTLFYSSHNPDPLYYHPSPSAPDNSTDYKVHIFAINKCKNVAMLGIPPSSTVRAMSFLPDDESPLVSLNYDFLLLRNHITRSIFDKNDTKKPKLEFGDIIPLPNVPVWHGVPIWLNKKGEQYYLWAKFPQHDDPVPVLWVPRELRLQTWTLGHSMIALGCANGRILILRPHTTVEVLITHNVTMHKSISA